MYYLSCLGKYTLAIFVLLMYCFVTVAWPNRHYGCQKTKSIVKINRQGLPFYPVVQVATVSLIDWQWFQS